MPNKPKVAKPRVKKTNVLLICDTNIVVKMALFDPNLMFNTDYSFGEVAVHEVVLKELRNWISKPTPQLQRFGVEVLKDLVARCEKKSKVIPEVREETLKKSIMALSVMEKYVPSGDKGSDTSRTDKTLLTLAWINKANLATEERTMTSVAKRSLGSNRVFSFGKLIQDLFQMGLLTKTEIKDGLENLSKFDENLLFEDKLLIDSLLREKKKK